MGAKDAFDLEDGTLFEHEQGIFEKLKTVTDNSGAVTAVEVCCRLFKSGNEWKHHAKTDTTLMNPYAKVQPVRAEFPHI